MNNTLILNPSVSIIRGTTLKLRFNIKILWILYFLLIITFLVFYIFQVNFLAKETYQIQNYQQKLNKTTQENETLRVDSMKLNSLANIETLIKDFGFEKAQKIHYIQVLESQVVTK